MRKLFTLAAVAILGLTFQQSARASAGSYAAAFINAGYNYSLTAFNSDPISDVTIAQVLQYAEYAHEAASAAQAGGSQSRAYWGAASQLSETAYTYAFEDYQSTGNTYSLYAAVYFYYAHIYAYYASIGY